MKRGREKKKENKNEKERKIMRDSLDPGGVVSLIL